MLHAERRCAISSSTDRLLGLRWSSPAHFRDVETFMAVRMGQGPPAAVVTTTPAMQGRGHLGHPLGVDFRMEFVSDDYQYHPPRRSTRRCLRSRGIHAAVEPPDDKPPKSRYVAKSRYMAHGSQRHAVGSALGDARRWARWNTGACSRDRNAPGPGRHPTWCGLRQIEPVIFVRGERDDPQRFRFLRPTWSDIRSAPINRVHGYGGRSRSRTDRS